MERETSLLESMRAGEVERLRFRRIPGGVKVVAARRDAEWEDARSLLPASESDFADILELFGLGGHERLDLVFRDEIGLRFICAVHSSAHGRGAGGLRRRDLVVPEREVLAETLNLARAMTYKNTAAGLPRGGSKLSVHGSPLPEYDRERWIRILAEEIDLSGTQTGPDSGFPAGVYHDLAAISSNVTGVRAGGTSHSAAFGTHLAIQASIAALGLPMNEAKVLVLGLGSLGTLLAQHLVKDGARLVVTDLDHRRIDAFFSGLSAEERRLVDVAAPYQVLDVAVDLLAPCALGSVVSAENSRRLKCRAICGGANLQLAASSLNEEMRIARQLRESGVLYVPDWLASAGGTIHGVLEAESGEDFDIKKCQARIRRVCGWLVDELLEDAKRTGRAPLEIAVERWLK